MLISEYLVKYIKLPVYFGEIEYDVWSLNFILN